MAAIEILLLVIGVIFFVSSFFIVEKLSPDELKKIGDLSNGEIQKVMEKELQKVSGEIEGRVDEAVEKILLDSTHSMEVECKEKLANISGYADTIVDSMNKTHNEIMFLYSMLNDKHTELTQFSAELQDLMKEMERKEIEVENRFRHPEFMREIQQESELVTTKEEPIMPSTMELPEETMVNNLVEEEELINHNSAILMLYKEGKDMITIAKELGLGIGEVQLVIGLYEGKRK